MRVTGPSPTLVTLMSAPNTPFSTRIPSLARASQTASYAGSLTGCGAAACAPLWSAATGSPVTGGPIVSNGRVYAGLQDGRMVAYGLAGG